MLILFSFFLLLFLYSSVYFDRYYFIVLFRGAMSSSGFQSVFQLSSECWSKHGSVHFREGRKERNTGIYRPAPHFHRDRRRLVELGSGRRDKPLHAEITTLRGKQRPVAWNARAVLAAATRQPSSHSPVDLWSCHPPTSRRRCTVAWKRPRRRSAAAPPASRKLSLTIPSKRTRNLRKFILAPRTKLYYIHAISEILFINHTRLTREKITLWRKRWCCQFSLFL